LGSAKISPLLYLPMDNSYFSLKFTHTIWRRPISCFRTNARMPRITEFLLVKVQPWEFSSSPMNLEGLAEELKGRRYEPTLVRRVYIPKSDGGGGR